VAIDQHKKIQKFGFLIGSCAGNVLL